LIQTSRNLDDVGKMEKQSQTTVVTTTYGLRDSLKKTQRFGPRSMRNEEFGDEMLGKLS